MIVLILFCLQDPLRYCIFGGSPEKNRKKFQMLKIHCEGYTIIAVVFIGLFILNSVLYWLMASHRSLFWIFPILSVVFLSVVIWFFRNPVRPLTPDPARIYAPADGKVVIIEKVYEPEYFKDERIQVSIFMSPLNVHVNRYPVSGEIVFYKYHPGDYLVAWHPKSSTLNERTTVVIETEGGRQVLVRQIAGAVARRIVCYSKVGGRAVQGQDLGFIKFGSRVDLFLPLDTPINVEIGQKVEGNITVISQK